MTILLPTGQSIRSASKRRYTIVIARPGERPFVLRHTDSAAKASQAKAWNDHCYIIDTKEIAA